MTSYFQQDAAKGTHHTTEIAIVGSGAVGKAAALALAHAGWQVALVSPAAKPVQAAMWDTRVYALNHTAQSLLGSLKVWDAMDMSRIASVTNMAVFGDEAPGKLAFDAYGAHADALTWIVEDSNLNAALDTALRFSRQIRVVQAKAVALDVRADAATLTLDNGEVLSCALVVGADGKQSWVRAQADIGLDYRPYGQRAIVASFACEQPHHGTAYQWFTGSEGIIALLPLPGNHVSLVWSAPEQLVPALKQLPPDELAQRLTEYAMPVLGRISPLQPHVVQDFPLELVRPHSMVAERVVLVGDAAHAVHPLAGHGMNLGFGDVVALQACLSDKMAIAEDPARVLRRYARMRKEEVLLMQVATDGLARVFETDLPPVRIARNWGMNLINSLPVLKKRLIAHAMGK